MKLTDIQPKTDAKFISRVINSYFASKVDVPALKENNARTMLTKVKALIKETKSTPKFHTSEKSPAYLQLLMMEQALTSQLKEYGQSQLKEYGQSQLKEYGADSARYQGGTAYTNPTSSVMANIKPEDDKEEVEDDDVEEACGSSAKLMAGKKKYGKKKMKEAKLTESEVETAQVVLAAQDMVDKIAGWMEDVADMQYKDLPGLVEMMRNEVGVNEAQAFLDAQTATLTTLLGSLEQAKTEATAAMAPLTGEQAVDPSEFSGEPDLEPDLDAGVDNDTPPEADSDGDITEPDLEPDLGRERR
jgi:hypothetical protein